MHPEPTELLFMGCLTESIWNQKFKSSMSTPNTDLQTYWQKEISHAMIGTIFFICAQNFSLTSCTKTMTKRMQEQEGENRIVAKSKPAMNLVSLVSRSSSSVQSPSASKSLGCSKHIVEQIGQVQGNLRQEISITTQRRVLKDGKKRCVSGRKSRQTCRDRRRRGTPELSWRFSKYDETRRNRRQWQSLATKSPYFNTLRAAHGEGFLDRETKICSQPDGSKEEPRCERSNVGYIYVCHSSSSSSSWWRLYRKFTICQESTKEIFETVVSSDWEVDHGSDRNYWTDQDWLAAACAERDDCQLTELFNLQLPKTSAFSNSVLCPGGISDETVKA